MWGRPRRSGLQGLQGNLGAPSRAVRPLDGLAYVSPDGEKD